jgi:hypothetical protein
MTLEHVDQDVVTNDVVSRGATVDGAALEASGALQEIGELRDDVEIDIAVLTDDAGVDGICPGDEDANKDTKAPVATDSGIYCDYYDVFGEFSFLYFL